MVKHLVWCMLFVSALFGMEPSFGSKKRKQNTLTSVDDSNLPHKSLSDMNEKELSEWFVAYTTHPLDYCAKEIVNGTTKIRHFCPVHGEYEPMETYQSHMHRILKESDILRCFSCKFQPSFSNFDDFHKHYDAKHDGDFSAWKCSACFVNFNYLSSGGKASFIKRHLESIHKFQNSGKILDHVIIDTAQRIDDIKRTQMEFKEEIAQRALLKLSKTSQ